MEESLSSFGAEFKPASLFKKIGAGSPAEGFEFQRALKIKVQNCGLNIEEDELEDFHVYQLL